MSQLSLASRVPRPQHSVGNSPQGQFFGSLVILPWFDPVPRQIPVLVKSDTRATTVYTAVQRSMVAMSHTVGIGCIPIPGIELFGNRDHAGYEAQKNVVGRRYRGSDQLSKYKCRGGELKRPKHNLDLMNGGPPLVTRGQLLASYTQVDGTFPFKEGHGTLRCKGGRKSLKLFRGCLN